MGTRGNGPSNVKEKVAKLNNTHIVSSIVRRGAKDPKSETFIYLNTKERQFDNIYNSPRSALHQDIYPTVLEEAKQMPKNKKSMKLNLVVFFEIAKVVEIMDEEHKDLHIQNTLMADERLEQWLDPDINKLVWVVIKLGKPCSTKAMSITSGNMKNTLAKKGEQIHAKTILIASHEGPYWFVIKFLKVVIHGFKTNPERVGSYIPTPEKYNNSRCGFIQIQNDDNECFKWCMKYHQTKKETHCDRISVLIKVEDKYDYSGVNYPASFEDIERFEKILKLLFLLIILMMKTTSEKKRMETPIILLTISYIY